VTILPADDKSFRKGLELYGHRPDKNWSVTDCISFIVMKERGLMYALTADHHFEQSWLHDCLQIKMRATAHPEPTLRRVYVLPLRSRVQANKD
jgi:hypothetical protein